MIKKDIAQKMKEPAKYNAEGKITKEYLKHVSMLKRGGFDKFNSDIQKTRESIKSYQKSPEGKKKVKEFISKTQPKDYNQFKSRGWNE